MRMRILERFVYEGLPSRVVFGWGALDVLLEEVERFEARRILVLATPEQQAQAARIAGLLGDRSAGVFAGAAMHTPTSVTDEAIAVVRAADADCTLAVGGGSTTGLGKAISKRTELRQIVVPTTYAGSEMTPILGETSEGVKTTERSARLLPGLVIYDPQLTLSLPRQLSVTSGINAIAHAVEALYARDRNPIVSMMAEEGIRSIAAALPRIVDAPGDRDARSDALYGAWLCGIALGAVGMALHHKLCHVLGGSFDLPHSETHTVLLPHVMAYNAISVPEAARRVARALGEEDAGGGLFKLARDAGAPTALRDLGMPAADLDRAADLASLNPYWNPRPIDRRAIRSLLDDAWHGRDPAGQSD